VTDQGYTEDIASDTGPFTIIPEWIIDAQISHGAVRLYALLGRYADYNTGRAFPSRKLLASRLRVSTHTVDRMIVELVNVSAVEVLKRYESGRWLSNVYIVKRLNPSRIVAGSRISGTTPSPIGGTTPSPTNAELTRTTKEQEPTERERETQLRSDHVSQVFNLWLTSTSRDMTRTKLDSKRRARIEWALKNYTLEDVLDAVQGWQNSPFHAGRNEQNKIYNDLTLILRDADRLEHFRDAFRSTTKNTENVPKTWHRLRQMMGEEQ
jgi:hypothetical protein